jgi:hypothetical protein
VRIVRNSHDRRKEVLFENTNAVRRPGSSAEFHSFDAGLPRNARGFPIKGRLAQPGNESSAVASFASWVNALGPLSQASPALRASVLKEVAALARRIDTSAETGVAFGYGRRVLCDDPDRWSLAAISLRYGQHTELHDHGGWGCAATVQGIERNRIFAHDTSGDLTLAGERDYPPGTGYLFDAAEVHQPVGADQHLVTVALHFLVCDSHGGAHPEPPTPAARASAR